MDSHYELGERTHSASKGSLDLRRKRCMGERPVGKLDPRCVMEAFGEWASLYAGSNHQLHKDRTVEM